MISTHILDTSLGLPAAGVRVILEMLDGPTWRQIAEDHTNTDGRIKFDCPKKAGYYKLIFETEGYFNKSKTEHFFLNTPVLFGIKNTERNYHVPLLLNPFGFSTYRGS
jgi:5-hydroxyisourate hydrolase